MDAQKRRELEEVLRQRAALPPAERWALLARDIAGVDEAEAQPEETDTWLEGDRDDADDPDEDGEPATDDAGDIVFVAYQDRGRMVPISSEDGCLVTFATWEEANKAKGALGVAAPETPLGLRIVCRAHGLRLPRNGNGRG